MLNGFKKTVFCTINRRSFKDALIVYHLRAFTVVVPIHGLSQPSLLVVSCALWQCHVALNGLFVGGLIPHVHSQATPGLAAPPSHGAQPFQHSQEGNSFSNMPAQPYGQDMSGMGAPPSNTFFYGGQL